MNEKLFIEEMNKLGFNLNEKQLNQFVEYYNYLVQENEKINLTAITEKEQVYLKHFYDSATIIKIIDLSKENNFCDVGTGAGFPGVVLKILYPDLKVTLVDSLNKRINFLNSLIQKLDLNGIIAIHDRAEDFARKNREQFDVVTARAVTNLPVLLEYCIPLLKVEKYFIPMKGDISQEINLSETAFKKLSSSLLKVEKFNLPIENSKRTLLFIKKNKKTLPIYPRKNSEINKHSL